MGAVTVKSPSEDSDEVTQSGLTSSNRRMQIIRKLWIKRYLKADKIHTWQKIAPSKLSGYKTMLVLLFFMFGLYNDKFVSDLDINLVRRKLLDIQNHFKLFVIDV